MTGHAANQDLVRSLGARPAVANALGPDTVAHLHRGTDLEIARRRPVTI